MKLISIIIPMFNAQNSITTTLESIISQKYKKAEIIIIDDGSIDRSKEIVQTYLDDDIKYIYQDNKGVSAARNLGIENSQGKYVMFVDADDTLKKGSLNIIDKVLTNENPDLLIFNSGRQNINRYSSELSNILSSFISNKNISGYVWNKLFSLNYIKYNNLFFYEDIHFCEDLLFCVEYYIKSDNLSIKYISNELYNYEPNESSITSLAYSSKKETGILAIQSAIEVLLDKRVSKEIINVYYDFYYRFVINVMINSLLSKMTTRKETRKKLRRFDLYSDKGTIKTKLKFHLLYLSPSLTALLYLCYKRYLDE